MTGSYNYKTYYIGTPKELEDSGSLVLLRAEDFGGISLDNLGSLQDLISKNPEKKPVKTTLWKDPDGTFKLEFGESEIFSFDTIIYVNPVSGYVGYTIFSSLQHCYSSSGIPFRRLSISLVFNRFQGEGNGVSLRLYTYLDPNAKNTKIYGDTERWMYQESEDISFQEEGYLKFTNKPSDYSGDPDLSILGESGIITHDFGASGMYLLSGVEVDSDSFSTLIPTLYKGDVAILKYSHQTGEYCVSSLTRLNSFGRPHDYTSGIIGETPDTFLGGTAETLLFSEGDDYIMYYPEEKKFSRQPKQGVLGRNCVVINKWDPLGKVIYAPESSIKEEVTRVCKVPPEFSTEDCIYHERNGGWWVFKIKSDFLYVSVYGVIRSGYQIGFISDRLGYYIDKGVYHFLPIEMGHTYVSMEGRILDQTSRAFVDFSVKSSTPVFSLPKDIRTFLSGLRRKPLRLRGCLPEYILGSGLGMIFYLSDGLLYCY